MSDDEYGRVGPTLPPNKNWCSEHAGERLELTYGDETYVVAVERGDD